MSQTGDYLARLRAERGLSKYAVEEATDIDHSNLYKIEHGTRFPTLDVMDRLRRAYGFTTSEADYLLQCLSDDLLTPYWTALYGKAVPV